MRQHDDRARSSPPIARLAAMCLLLAATGLRGPPASAQASTAPLAIAWSRYQLPNGLDVVLAPVDTATEVSIEWWVHVGARHEAPGRFGLAHFFEHAMPFGQGVIRTRLGRQLFDSMRTNSNALTRFDYTRYYTQARAEAIDLFLLAAADRLRADPTLELTPERINAHRRNVLGEIDRAAGGTWGWPIKSRLNAGTFGPNHPYGHHTYGSDVETRETSADDMLRWFRAHIRPEYTTLIVVGRFDTVAVRSSIERTFGGMTGGTRPARATPSVPVTAPSADSVTIVSDRSHAFLSWAVPHWASDERAPLTLLARVLTERMAANRPPSVEEAKADAEFWELAGRFGVRATFSSEPDRRTIETWLRREVARLLAADVTERELRIARQAEINDIREQMMALGWENSRSELLGEGVIFADDPGAYLLELARQNTVTPNDARRTALRWLAGPGFFLVVRGAARK